MKKKNTTVARFPTERIVPLHPRVLEVENGNLLRPGGKIPAVTIVLRRPSRKPAHVVFRSPEALDTFVRMIRDTRAEVWPGEPEQVNESRITKVRAAVEEE